MWEVGASQSPATAAKQDIAPFTSRLPVARNKTFSRFGDASTAAGGGETDWTQLDVQLPLGALSVVVANRLLAARGAYRGAHGVRLQPQGDLILVVLDKLLQLIDVPKQYEFNL